ncbi:MAG TPA: Flp pilus assembly protein CpaB [Candidatus Binataceae bacterium]|nr:Flp pilus assembly protein CpaB [Candidatus Binataceae bacterium]
MRRSLLFMMLAGVAALVAALVVYSALKKREREVQEAMAQSVTIVVAAHDLHIGTQLDPTAVKLVRWSRDSMPPGAFTDIAAVAGKYVKTPYVENEPIVADRLFSGVKTAGMLPLLIPAGMRAMSVPVDEVSDISGFVLPGAHVDILVSITDKTTGGQPFSKIVLQNVEVIAVAQEIEEAKDEPKVVKVVTVLLTPEEAERLALASHDGTLRLALRNYEDKKIVMTNGSNVASMLRGGSAPPVMEHQAVAPVAHIRARPRPKAVRVEILRDGTKSESVSFVHGRGARNTESLNPEMVGSAGASFEMAAVENPTPAPVAAPAASAPPATGRMASAASSRHGAHAPVPSGVGFTGAPTDNPLFAGPNSKTIDVP